MRRELLNPAYRDFEKISLKIQETGARVVSLGNGFYKPPLDRVLNESLLGMRLGRKFDLTSLSQQEIIALRNEHPYILTITDLDGVLSQPLAGMILKRERKIPFNRLLFLKNLVRASNETWLLTSRFDSEVVREKFPFLRGIVNFFQKNRIDSFPFLSSSNISDLERVFKGKLAVQNHKSLDPEKRSEQLKNIIFSSLKRNVWPNNRPYVIYIIGSSVFDRRAVLNFCLLYPEIASHLVYFDTVHLFL